MHDIALITIGQSPREDIVASMFDGRAPRALVECGALDDLSREEIRALQPHEGEHPLVSRLRDRTEVVIAKERLMPHMQAALDRAVKEGAAIAVILCTGEFSQLTIPIPAIYPDRVLVHTIDALLPSGTVGVMLPHAGQMETMHRKWTTPSRTFVGTAVSPYTAQVELGRRAEWLKLQEARLIVLDCMGFDGPMKHVVAEASGLPTILANRLVGRVVEELT